MKSSSDIKKQYSILHWLLFIIPSLLGIIMFMVPIKMNDRYMVPIAYISEQIKTVVSDYVAIIILLTAIFSGIITIAIKLFSAYINVKKSFFKTLFNPSWGWFLVRFIGISFIIITFFQEFSEIIYSQKTGGFIFYELLPTLLSIFIIAPICLPFLISFGLLEFVGSIASYIMRPVFNLPGRSAIDCIASWLGDCSVAILMTNNQYENSQYTKKEAAIIATNFSLVSITFSLVVIAQVGLENMFAPFYFTVCLSGIACAIITPRIPPLSRKQDVFISGKKRPTNFESINTNLYKRGINKALAKVSKLQNIGEIFADAIKSSIELIVSVLPTIMTVGTMALIAHEYTPIFDYLGMPFIPLLKILQIPEAEHAASALLLGFSDMFIPSILATSFATPMTKFFVATVSLSQLIYLSEVGALLLGSKIPLSFLDLLIIFLQRTIVSIPIAAAASHLFF